MLKGLTKYVVGAKANPPKNPKRPPKKGKLIPTNIVKAAEKKVRCSFSVSPSLDTIDDPG